MVIFCKNCPTNLYVCKSATHLNVIIWKSNISCEFSLAITSWVKDNIKSISISKKYRLNIYLRIRIKLNMTALTLTFDTFPIGWCIAECKCPRYLFPMIFKISKTKLQTQLGRICKHDLREHLSRTIFKEKLQFLSN